ncbi:hypothetical protein GH733_013678 [Mirounga leonina]|nr:hypothetical protein GH733_013678 [Mirounga leonina]
MANQTNISTPYNSYEYYLDYLDLIPVDERKLKANKCPPCSPPGTGCPWGPPTASADIRNKRDELPPGDRTSQL